MIRRVLAAVVFFAACARPELPRVSPVTRAPDVRVGVVVGEGSLTLGGPGGGALALSTAEHGWVGEVPGDATATVDAAEGALRVRIGEAVLRPGLAVIVSGGNSSTPVRLNGRDYRGQFTIHLRGDRITAINLVDLEEYLVGVVGTEMGIRSGAEQAALEAQAVVSRTITLQRIGQSRTRPFDLLATVADQAYAGQGAEAENVARAVRQTRGLAVMYQGAVIDAFFHSTCGGRTARGTEVFAAADRPYLQSIADHDDGGRAWCAISPRFRWQERWTAEELARTLRGTLPAAGTSGEVAALRDIRVVERTGTGRVARLEVVTANGTHPLTGPRARQVLRPVGGGLLRSADFIIQVTRNGEQIVGLAAEGSGAGHGVGMCQWGAIGRARAGFSFQSIVSAYFPGTEISRVY